MQPYKRSSRPWRSRRPRSLQPTCWRRRVCGWKKPWTACREAAGSCASSNPFLEASACSAGLRSQPLRCWSWALAPGAGPATNSRRAVPRPVAELPAAIEGRRQDCQRQQHRPRTKHRECRSTLQSPGSGNHPGIARRSADTATPVGGGAKPGQPWGGAKFCEPAGRRVPGRSPVLRWPDPQGFAGGIAI